MFFMFFHYRKKIKMNENSKCSVLSPNKRKKIVKMLSSRKTVHRKWFFFQKIVHQKQNSQSFWKTVFISGRNTFVNLTWDKMSLHFYNIKVSVHWWFLQQIYPLVSFKTKNNEPLILQHSYYVKHTHFLWLTDWWIFLGTTLDSSLTKKSEQPISLLIIK